MTSRASLRRRYRGAAPSLRRALRDAAGDSALPRATRRELARAAESVEIPRGRHGTAWFPAVLPGTGDGVLYRVIASDGPRQDLTRLPEGLDERLRRWVSRHLPELGLEGLVLHLSGPPPGEAWDGRSCELALLVAAVSWALSHPRRAGLVVTGALDDEGLAPVAHLDDKASVVARDLPDHRLVAPGRAGPRAILDQLLEPGWRVALEARAARAQRHDVRRARALTTAGRYAEAEALAGPVADDDRVDVGVRASATWVLASCALHRGDAARGLKLLDAVRTALPRWEDHEDAPPEDLTREELVAWSLVALVDTGCPAAAWRLGRDTLDELRDPTRRSARWRMAALQVAGSTHRAALALGRLDEAEALLRSWSLDRARLDHQTARSLGDLAEVQRRRGDQEGARASLRAARAALADCRQGERGMTSRFLALHQARLDVDEGHPAPTARSGPLWPELGFRLLAARSRGPTEALASLTEPAIRDSLALTWVVAAEVIRAGGEIPRDVWARLRFDDRTLRSITETGDGEALAARCPY